MRIRITAIASLLALAGCTTTVADTACTSFQPITYSAKGDTPETIRQIREFNAAWGALCNG